MGTPELVERRKNLSLPRLLPYLYLMPLIVLVGVVIVYPFFHAILLGFWQKDILKAAGTRFIGLDNYVKLLTGERNFWLALRNSIVFTMCSVFLEYVLGLVSALTLNSKYIRARNFFRALILLPWIIPIVVNSLMWKFMLAPNFGFIGQLLAAVGLKWFQTVNWLGDVNLALPTVILVNVWRSFPFYTIVILAGLTLIPQELYEAAAIDGAKRWQRFSHITFPLLKGVSGVVVVLHIIWTFINFDVIYLLTGGGPLYSTEVLPTLLYRKAFEEFSFGYASSIGVVMLLILMFIVGKFYTKVIINRQ
ncbi:MAG: sugar ABC transporter permease [Firmicutes bacterium]|nr:sugar ABC transporter permease [Bacillota bacterium]